MCVCKSWPLRKWLLSSKWSTVQAEKKKVSVEDLTSKITNAGGPASSGTKAEANKFHDDKALYTGIVLSYSVTPELSTSSLCCRELL